MYNLKAVKLIGLVVSYSHPVCSPPFADVETSRTCKFWGVSGMIGRYTKHPTFLRTQISRLMGDHRSRIKREAIPSLVKMELLRV